MLVRVGAQYRCSTNNKGTRKLAQHVDAVILRGWLGFILRVSLWSELIFQMFTVPAHAADGQTMCTATPETLTLSSGPSPPAEERYRPHGEKSRV
jgi:hypothetical protein